MVRAAIIHRTEQDRERLRRVVEALLAQARSAPVHVARLDCRPGRVAARAPTEVLTLTLGSGEVLSLFLKSPGSEEADHPEKQRRDREVRLYEELLGDAGLPVARYYGSSWNGKEERRELFLEHVDDWDMRYQVLDHWYPAAARLAHLHAHFAARRERLLGCDFLLHFDEESLLAWADRALDAVAAQSAALARRVEGLRRRYEGPAQLVARQPVTLVHNDLAPKNVMVDRSATPARVCIVDWEMAGMGCALLDLVHLKDGLDPESDRRMRQSYFEALAGTGLVPDAGGERERLLAACELHHTLVRLWGSKRWGVPLSRVEQWVADAEALLARI